MEGVLTFTRMIERKLRIVFMGTPAFAVPSLQILLEAGYTIAAVITAPDKPGGRGMKQMMVSPVKSFAIEHGIPVLQPVNLKSRLFLQQLRKLQADLQVVVAFRMLPKVVWDMPRYGTMNLHGSLLPAYRGAAPIQWAIINGEEVTGVTTFLLQHEIDTGEILAQAKIPILYDDHAGKLHDRMMYTGAGIVIGSVDLIQSGDYRTFPQDESTVSHAPKLEHQHGYIDWKKPSVEIRNLVRGLSPFPGAWGVLDGQECKVLVVEIANEEEDHAPGTLILKGKKMIVQTGNGQVEIMELQMAGKKRMTTKEFLNGYQPKALSWT